MTPVEEALLTIFGAVSTVAISAIAVWLQKHLNIQNDATRNREIAAAAQRLAAFLLPELERIGLNLIRDKVDETHPAVVRQAKKLMTRFPSESEAMAAHLVLGEALRLKQLGRDTTTNVTVLPTQEISDVSKP